MVAAFLGHVHKKQERCALFDPPDAQSDFVNRFKLRSRVKTDIFNQSMLYFLRATSKATTYDGLGLTDTAFKDDPLANCPICSQRPGTGTVLTSMSPDCQLFS
jgi:hypothetical protein